MKKSVCYFFISVVLMGMVLLMFPSCDKIINQPDTSGLKKGDTVWVYEIPESEKLTIPDSYMAIGNNGDLYFEVRDVDNEEAPRVYAITKNGKFKWKTVPLNDNGLNGENWGEPDPRLNSAILVGDNGDIYCTSGPFIYSINHENGQVNWTWECPKTLPDDNGNPINSYSTLVHLALTNNGDLVTENVGCLACLPAGAMFCVDQNGQLKWIYRRLLPTGNHFSIGPDGNIYSFYDYWGPYSRDFYLCMSAVNPDDGTAIWEKQKVSSNGSVIPVFTSDGDVLFDSFFPDDNQWCYTRMNTGNSQPIWKVLSVGLGCFSSIVDKNDNVFAYFGNFGWINIPDGTTGEITDPEPLYLPVSPNIDTKGHFTGGQDYTFENIISTDASGNVLWNLNKLGQRRLSVTLSDDKILYFSSYWDAQNNKPSNKIIAIKWDASLEHSGWPRYTHDNRNTFNYNKW